MNEQQYQSYRSFRLQAGLAAIWVLMLALIVGTLAASIGYLFGQNLNPAYPAVERFTAKQKAESTSDVASKVKSGGTLADYEYFMSEEFSSVSPDRQLLRRPRGTTDQGEVVAISVRDLAGVKADDRWTLTILAQPAEGGEFWVSKILPQTDAGLEGVWAFNTETNTLTPLPNASAALSGYAIINPQGLYALSVAPQTNDPAKLQQLELINLRTDTVTTLVQLEGSETLSRFLELGHVTEITWIDATHVSYAVYDSTKKEGEKFKLKEKRTITIPD
jgi:hypothetical protein